LIESVDRGSSAQRAAESAAKNHFFRLEKVMTGNAARKY
jgi:hypothetical protein